MKKKLQTIFIIEHAVPFKSLLNENPDTDVKGTREERNTNSYRN